MTSSDFQKNDRCESISAACDNFLSVRLVPEAEVDVDILNVGFGGVGNQGVTKSEVAYIDRGG